MLYIRFFWIREYILDNITKKWLLSLLNELIAQATEDALKDVSVLHKDRKLAVIKVIAEIKGTINKLGIEL